MNQDVIIAKRENKIVYRDGNKCIKLFNDEYSKADVLNEALNQSRVENTTLHVPAVLEVCSIEGKWAIISEYIEGDTLAKLMEEHPEKKEEYVELLVELQMAVHRENVPLLNKMKDKMTRKIAETEFNATTRYDLHTRLEEMPKHSKLCHGDFNPSNIIIAKDGTPYIVDWSHASQGNASADVARTYLLFWLENDIAAAELYLTTFCKKSDTNEQYIRKWIPIVAASLSINGSEKEKELLMSWEG